MAEVLQTSTNINSYDFFEAIEEFNNISGKNESSCNLTSLQESVASKKFSQQDAFNNFLKACNNMNAMESTDSLLSLSTVSSRNSLSGIDNAPESSLSVFSFFKAMETLSLSSPHSIGDFSQTIKLDNTANEFSNNIFYDFFLKLESFLELSDTE